MEVRIKATTVHEYILGFQVAVDDCGVVEELYPERDLDRPAEWFLHTQAVAVRRYGVRSEEWRVSSV